MRETPEAGRKRFDLSVPQVAGSALAAVVAAKLASYFGVYGTILGAGLVSVIATCGGSLFQQAFRRTGEQLREAKTVPRSMGRARGQETHRQEPSAAGGFGEATVYRARVKSWKRPVLAAALVFGVTMAGITTYELVSGSSFSGGGGTTVSDAVGGGRGAHSPEPGDGAPSSSPSSTPRTGGATAGEPGGTGRTGTAGQATPEPDRTPGQGSGTTTPSGPDRVTPTPTPTPGATTTVPTVPEPSASSRSGTAVPGQDGSATP
ncbi:hypothetical protein [Streptomyces sp. NPDC005573]|uniref:hypothetical protein n=1 Tax=Streptomyces sp. NPDC005573 TaxID=3156890 RepID=UPI0033A0C978